MLGKLFGFGKPQKLKRIPSDMLAYIQIEGEAIKDANDKQMIVSYAYGKLDTISWYIELLTTGSEKYIVPHSLEHLNDIKQQLMAIIKKIMNTPVPSSSAPLISIEYPKGHEG